MSYIFILIMCKNYVPSLIMRNISPYATKYDFLWVGGNSIKNYHIHQYKGPVKNIRIFKKEINNILNISKKNNKIKCYSIISGNTKPLDKPTEHDFTIYSFKNSFENKIDFQNIKNIKKLSIKTKNILKVISNLKKIKFLNESGYYLPISLTSIIKEHPIKIRHNLFLIVNENNILIYGEHKHPIKTTKTWLIRLSKLLQKDDCF